MEVLVVLAIFALSTAVVMPSMSRMLDQTTSHAVFFEFQRQMSDLRREASRTGLPITVIDPEMAALSPTQDDERRLLELRDPWTYSLSPAMVIEAGGRCGAGTARLIQQGRVVMRLETEDGTCRFTRYQLTEAERQSAP